MTGPTPVRTGAPVTLWTSVMETAEVPLISTMLASHFSGLDPPPTLRCRERLSLLQRRVV